MNFFHKLAHFHSKWNDWSDQRECLTVSWLIRKWIQRVFWFMRRLIILASHRQHKKKSNRIDNVNSIMQNFHRNYFELLISAYVFIACNRLTMSSLKIFLDHPESTLYRIPKVIQVIMHCLKYRRSLSHEAPVCNKKWLSTSINSNQFRFTSLVLNS